MKLVPNLFIMFALLSMLVAVVQKFYGISLMFSEVDSISYVIFANTCLLLALVLKLAKD
jgi:hypothetical protein